MKYRTKWWWWLEPRHVVIAVVIIVVLVWATLTTQPGLDTPSNSCDILQDNCSMAPVP